MNAKGLTLPELLLALFLACMCTLVATTAGSYLIPKWQLRSASHELFSALRLARQRAITQRKPILIKNIENSWSKGWEVFVDANGDTMLDPGETVIFTNKPSGSLRISSNFGSYVRYLPNGETRYVNGAFMAGTLLLCSTKNTVLEARKLIINRGGRVRSAMQTATGCGGSY